MNKLRPVLLAVPLALFPWLVMGPLGEAFQGLALRLVALVVLSFAGAALLQREKRDWLESALASLLLVGFVYKIAAFLPEVSTYPFSLGWSETSRFYYASLYLSERIYGLQTPPSVLHPSRYLMQAAPFLLQDSPLWLHRLWQVLLWVAFSLGTALVLGRRLAISNLRHRLMFVAWAFLFLFQGPVYYHLTMMVILVVWGFNPERFWRSLLVMLVASAWAGISRVNWLPMPGLLAAALYLLEVPIGKQSWLRYLWRPAAWVSAGTAVGFASQWAYQTFSGNPVEQFGSSFTSDLLWYRLLPSRTYPLGVLPAVFLVSLPLLLLVLFRLRAYFEMDVLVQKRKTNRDFRNETKSFLLRLSGLGCILFVLFAGGVVVSAKIGGGSNLHNLDAYLAMLLIIGSAINFDHLRPESMRTPAVLKPSRTMQSLLVSLALVTPVLYNAASGGQLEPRDDELADAALEHLRAVVTEAAQQGEVLFVSERHLLTFDMIEDVPLVPDYEKVFLMEMAMGNNRPYLEDFYADLNSHRFSLIVIHPQRIHYQGSGHQFGEENDAWVARVSEPLLCYYEERERLEEPSVQLLVPKEGCKKTVDDWR